MDVYVKWNYRDIGSGNEILREAMSRLSMLSEELRGIHRQLDAQLSEYDGIGRTLRINVEGAEEDVRRMRNECNALEGVIAVYAAAERAAMHASESLPTEIAERNLIFESWFSDLLR